MTQRKIRVLHLLYSMGVGGTERRVLRLGLGLDPERYAIHALTVRPVTGSTLPWPRDQHTYFPIPPGFQWARLSALARFMREGRFDVVHSHNWATMFYGVLGGVWLGRPSYCMGNMAATRGTAQACPGSARCCRPCWPAWRRG